MTAANAAEVNRLRREIAESRRTNEVLTGSRRAFGDGRICRGGQVTTMGRGGGNGSAVGPGLPGPPPQAWSSRAEMMRARAQAVDELEKAASHDWRRLAAGAVSLVLVLGGELVLLAIVEPETGLEWQSATFVVAAAAVLALAGGGVLGVRTWQKGRRIVSALVAWEELTDRVAPDGSYVPFMLREVEDAESDDERRHIWWRSWVWFRTRLITFPRMGRIAIGTLLLLFGGGVAAAAVVEAVQQVELAYLDVAVMTLSLTAALYGWCVWGGQWRFGMAMNRREFRMRRRLRRERRERREAWERKVAGG